MQRPAARIVNRTRASEASEEHDVKGVAVLCRHHFFQLRWRQLENIQEFQLPEI